MHISAVCDAAPHGRWGFRSWKARCGTAPNPAAWRGYPGGFSEASLRAAGQEAAAAEDAEAEEEEPAENDRDGTDSDGDESGSVSKRSAGSVSAFSSSSPRQPRGRSGGTSRAKKRAQLGSKKAATTEPGKAGGSRLAQRASVRAEARAASERPWPPSRSADGPAAAAAPATPRG